MLTLDCWGGNYAKATYKLFVPSGAFNIRRSIATRRTSLDYCCNGSISKWWSGNTATVQVTGWRAVDVVKVKVVYDLRRTV